MPFSNNCPVTVHKMAIYKPLALLKSLHKANRKNHTNKTSTVSDSVLSSGKKFNYKIREERSVRNIYTSRYKENTLYLLDSSDR